MAALLCKRGAAAHFSKSSSSSSSSTWTSRSLAESSNVRRVVNNNTLARGGRWAVRGYNDDASANSALPDELQKAMQLEIQKVRREIEKRNGEALERYFTSLQLETGKLRNEIERRDKESSEELQSVTQKLRSDIDVTSARIDVIGDVLREKTLKTTESIKAIDQSIKAIDQETDGDIRLLDKKIDELRADMKWQSNFTTLWFLSTYLWIWVFYK